jgi:hypothetical protein
VNPCLETELQDLLDPEEYAIPYLVTNLVANGIHSVGSVTDGANYVTFSRYMANARR